MVESDRKREERPEPRAPYEPPELRLLGAVVELTQGGGRSGVDTDLTPGKI